MCIGWPRCIKCLKVQVSFRERVTDYSALMHILEALCVRGGKDAQDGLSCRSLFAKEPLIIGLFCGK